MPYRNEDGPGVFNPETISEPINPNSHHTAGYTYSTATSERCACCRTGLHRADSRAAGMCLACRITADELAVV